MKTWLITGAGRGFGLSLAKAVIQSGDRVIGAMRDDVQMRHFRALHPENAIPIRLDVTDTDAVTKAISQIESDWGQIDVLVNSAGYGLTGALEETDLDQARRLFDVNLFGAIAMIQAVLPGMRARRSGWIVNISSVSGLAPWAGTSIYGASKYALRCISATLAEEVEPLGIKVMNVAPGGLRTGFGGASLVNSEAKISDYEQTAHLADHILREGAGKEPGDPDKAARAILSAMSSPEPPMELLLGLDAVKYTKAHFQDLISGFETWMPLSLSIAAE